MHKAVGIICSLSLMVVPICSRRQIEEESVMPYRSKRSSCCFVDIFCYTACFNHGYNLKALVPHERRFHEPETRRHRHRHQHRHRNHGFRTKRAIHDNPLWKKLRKSYEGKGMESTLKKMYLTHR